VKVTKTAASSDHSDDIRYWLYSECVTTELRCVLSRTVLVLSELPFMITLRVIADGYFVQSSLFPDNDSDFFSPVVFRWINKTLASSRRCLVSPRKETICVEISVATVALN